MPSHFIESRILLLLTILLPIVAGRLTPASWSVVIALTAFTFSVYMNALLAAPFTASFTPTPQVEFSESSETWRFAQAAWKHGQRYQKQFRHSFSLRVTCPQPTRIRLDMKAAPVGSSIYGPRRIVMGSAPPSCQGKCGSCVPCSPIHVSVGYRRPGSVFQQEYYPEVWRCQCGDNTFMPYQPLQLSHIAFLYQKEVANQGVLCRQDSREYFFL